MSDLIDVSPPGQLANDTLAGARAFFFNAGTTTLRTVYADEAEEVPHPSPLLADADGLFPQAFVSGGPVKVVVQDSTGATLYTMDPAIKVASAGQGASSVSFAPTLALPFTDVQAAIEGAAASAAAGFTPFGLGVTGSVAIIADLNATNIATGQYRFDATTTGTYPTGVSAADTGAIMLVRETAGSAWMWLYHDTTDRVFIRRMNSSTWGAWRENITANIGAAEGDLLYRTSTAWTRLAKGAAGQLLRMNSGATAPEWGGGGFTLLGTIATTSGSTQSLSGLNLSAYRKLEIVVDGVGDNSTTSGTFSIAGVSTRATTTTAANRLFGRATIDLTTGIITIQIGIAVPSGPPFNIAGADTATPAGKTALSTASTEVSVSMATTTFAAGTVYVYAV